ncbi:PHP domain-containing protein [Lactococcus termiticola]|uniref:Histidinol-phosphatase n=1 Tax=Lactococcus termiticola TaxID=2169526 RepID=A0A2R5HGT6_9LACT|nr:PHP domain-containing protein [Lactococcus termiticola]GBG97224.1 histidinol phosphatase [Lactococcus termiticola]
MPYHDQHLHTHFSFDSEADFESYLEAWPGKVVTTEHFDLSNPLTGGRDDIPDFKAYFKMLDDLKASYGDRLLSGIEIGYYQPREAEIQQILAPWDFDLKLLSVHHNDDFDYLEDKVAEMDFDAICQEYLDKLEYAVKRVPANVFAHWDYGLRLFELPVSRIKPYEGQLRRIFQKVIDQELAFEVNSKSIILYGHKEAYEYAIGLYQELGGKLFTLGSDGHFLEHFRLNFDDELIPWLKAQGIHELMVYEAGQASPCEI